MLTCDMVRQLLSIRKQPSSLSIHHAKKASTLARFMLYPIVLCHFTCHTMGKKVTYPFEYIPYYCWKSPLLPYWKANVRKMRSDLEILTIKISFSLKINIIFVISRLKCTGNSTFLRKKIPIKISPVLPYEVFTISFTPWFPRGEILMGIFFQET